MAAESSMGLDSFEVENCIRCNGDGGSGKLLVCSEMGCPVAIHGECMCSDPVFDELGKFYCPYCAYKREFLRTRELRSKAMDSKRVLSKFIDAADGNGCGCEGGRDGGVLGDRCVGVEGGEPKEGENEGRREIEDEGNGGENVCCRGEGETAGSGALRDDITKENLDQPCVSDLHELENVQGGERIYEAREEEGETVVEETPEVDEELENACYVHETRNEDSAHGGLDQGDEDGIRVPEENEGKSEDEEHKQPTEKEMPGNGTVVSESDEIDTGSPLVRKKRFKTKAKKTDERQNVASVRNMPSSPSRQSSSHQTSSVEEDAVNQNLKAKTFSKKEKEIQEFSRNLVLPDGKRKRLNWTDAEIEMLKEGVRTFRTANSKIPWKQILEFGHNVFHITRNPGDLKDKWRRHVRRKR